MRRGASGDVLGGARERAAAGLATVTAGLESAGMPAPEWTGKLIRPVMGLATVAGENPGSSFWRALAAVQLAHEASLLHDDVLDGARERRGEPTMAANRGIAAALVEGDHLLTASYRLAAETGSLAWAELFARAVERTVAGEKAQARACGRRLEWEEYEAVVLGKSGELMGAAFAAGPVLGGQWDAHRYHEVGRRVGLIYQMLDDLLDYCAHMETGKPAMADYGRGLWTWPRLYMELEDGLSGEDVARRLRAPGADGATPLDRCVDRLRTEVAVVRAEVAALCPADRIVGALLDEWMATAESAATAGSAAAPEYAAEPAATALPQVSGWETLMAEHAKSFRFASRLFPEDRRQQVVGVYAWCRYTDDLVDGVELPAAALEARLDAWLDLSRRAYEGEVTGNELADRVMGEMREGAVPFGYAEELIEGMRMDVRGVGYGTLEELRVYTFRVASVVGLWMTELFGIRDPWMLDRAAALGHAMQLTNILRDVGEDLEAGRLYLPTIWLRSEGLERADLARMAATGERDDRYRSLIERLLQSADAEYDHAAPAVDRLPAFYRRPVAVAAAVYRGIHDEIRANDYDNLTRRAHTGLATKLRLGAAALLRRRGSGTATGRDPKRARDRDAAGRSGARAALFGLALLLLLPALPAAAQDLMGGGLVDPGLVGIGRVWIDAVEEESAVAVGLDSVARVRERVSDDAADRLLRAYHGSLIALRAKHGGWPRERLRNLRDGFELMDAVVAEAPDAPELRYVRLMSGFYLPGFFGRKAEVARDMAALIRLLPDGRDTFPGELFPEVVRFVLENGEPGPDERVRLEALLP